MHYYEIFLRNQLLGHSQSPCKNRQLFEVVCIFKNTNQIFDLENV